MTANEKIPGTTKVGPYTIPNMTGGKAPGPKQSKDASQPSGEGQKAVTEKYRKGWDAIFGDKKR
ncbi:MAG: hypothetical protein O2905_05190 [Proteobacteria bacterium]|nr:hypothetical protein [Pseudomonadota bacterium]